MDNSLYHKYNKKLFNITGKIDDPQPKVENKSLVLMLNLLSDEKIITDADCDLNNNTENNYYNLNCTGREEFDGYLQSSVSFIDDNNILLINFQDSTKSNINVNDAKPLYRKFFRNSDGINRGFIAAIVIVSVVVLAAVIAIIYFRKKKLKNSIELNEDSTIRKLDVKENNT